VETGRVAGPGRSHRRRHPVDRHHRNHPRRANGRILAEAAVDPCTRFDGR